MDAPPFFRTLTFEYIDIPLRHVLANPSQTLSGASDNPSSSHGDPDNPPKEIFVVCRLGNDSQIAAQALRQAAVSLAASSGASSVLNESVTASAGSPAPSSEFTVMDVVGGLRGWSLHVDKTFPIY